MSVTIRVKRGTATQWAARTTPLFSGEIGYDLTNKITKIGDGTTLWASLPSIDSSGGSNTGDITFDGVQIIGAGTASGDGYGLGTLELVPDGDITSDQYLIIDPTAPNHIHIRAGGTQDASTADLFLGGERNNVLVSDNGRSVSISTRPEQVINTYVNANEISNTQFIVSNSANINLGDTLFFVEGGDTVTVNSITPNSPNAGLQTVTAELNGIPAQFTSGGTYIFTHEESYNNSWIFDSDGYLYGPGEGVLLLVEGIYNAKSNLTLQAMGINNKIVLDGQNGEFINDASDPENQIATLGDITAANEYTDQAVSSLGDTLDGAYVPISDVGNPEGVASLDINGKILDSEIPDTIARDSELKRTAVQWTANHYQLEGGANTRYLAGDIVYDGGSIFVANFDNESLPTTNTQYWTSLGSGNRLNIDGRDIPNILWDNILQKPTIPSLTGYATETYVNTAVSNLVDAAPETLDTLNELAAAINDDASYASTITTALGLKAPLASPTFTGKIDVNGTATSYLEAAHDGHTGSIDLQNTGIYLYTVSDDNLDSASIAAEQGILTLGTNYGEMYYDNLGLQIGMNGADSVNRLEVIGNTINPLTVNGNTTTFAGTVNFGSSTISNLSYSSLSIPVYSAIANLPAAADNHGRWAHVHGEGAMYFAHGGAWYRALSETDLYTSVNSQSTSYTLATTDLGKMIEMSGGGTLTVTDSSSFPTGFTVDILQTGSSQVTVTGNGFTINATPGLKLRTQWSSATLIKRGLNSWVLLGDLSA